MGGTKKPTISQMEKRQKLIAQRAEAAKAKKPSAQAGEKKPASVDPPKVGDSKLISELSKMKAITPWAVASQYNLRLSVAKDLLEQLEKRKAIRLVNGNARLKIYAPIIPST